MAKLGRNDPCQCGSGRKAKRCCGIERGPSEQSLARAFVSQAARAAVLDLPKIFPPALDRLLDAMEQDDVDAGEVPFRELVDKLDTPPERARLARAVIALRETGRLERELAAAALIDPASGSRELFAASLLEAAAVRAGIARTPGGLLLAA